MIPVLIPSHDVDIDEASLQRLILGRLAVLPGCGVLQPEGGQAGGGERAVFWRQNVIAVKGDDRFVRSGVPGQSDVAGVVLGISWSIECKRASGRQSKAQRLFEQRITRAGGVYLVARSLAAALVPVCQAMGLRYQLVAGEPVAGGSR
jgi:hypothetical protein